MGNDTNAARSRYADVLDSLRRLGPSTYQDLAHDTGRSLASVTRTMFVLVDLGLASPVAERPSATNPSLVWRARECPECAALRLKLDISQRLMLVGGGR